MEQWLELSINISLLYILAMIFFSKHTYIVLQSNKILLLYFLFASLFGAVWVYNIINLKDIPYDKLFYFTPLLYVIILVWINKIVNKVKGRNLIFANRYNMKSASEKWAIWIDYLAFIVIHFTPIFIIAIFAIMYRN